MSHISVLLHESIEALAIKLDGVYVDCTFGRGGHSREILKQLGEAGRLIVFDQDLTAIDEAQRLAQVDLRVTVVHANFSQIYVELEKLGLLKQVDGVLQDLGVSSPQLDEAERGFSFQKDGPLDMRMNKMQSLTAEQWVNNAPEQELADVFWRYGEERFSRKLAAAIVMDRVKAPFVSTKQLADMIARVLQSSKPGNKEKKHPATRVFQAIRIHVNQELQVLSESLELMPSVLVEGGRLAVISFHSLEDRLVKQFYKPKGHQGLRNLPIESEKPAMKAVSKAIKPSADEITVNPRSRSSVLRIFECQR